MVWLRRLEDSEHTARRVYLFQHDKMPHEAIDALFEKEEQEQWSKLLAKPQPEQEEVEETETQETVSEDEINAKKLEIMSRIEEKLADLEQNSKMPFIPSKEQIQKYLDSFTIRANLQIEKKREELAKLESALKIEIDNINKSNQISARILEALKEVQQANLGKDYSVVFVVSEKDGLMKLSYIIAPKFIDASNVRIVS